MALALSKDINGTVCCVINNCFIALVLNTLYGSRLGPYHRSRSAKAPLGGESLVLNLFFG